MVHCTIAQKAARASVLAGDRGHGYLYVNSISSALHDVNMHYTTPRPG